MMEFPQTEGKKNNISALVNETRGKYDICNFKVGASE
jgi:hypothetical protein